MKMKVFLDLSSTRKVSRHQSNGAHYALLISRRCIKFKQLLFPVLLSIVVLRWFYSIVSIDQGIVSENILPAAHDPVLGY